MKVEGIDLRERKGKHLVKALELQDVWQWWKQRMRGRGKMNDKNCKSYGYAYERDKDQKK